MTPRSPAALLLAAAATVAPAAGQHGAIGGEWREYGGDAGGTKYAPLGQIHPGNVGDLAIRWRWASPDNAIVDPDTGLEIVAFEATPLMKGGVLYTSTSFSQAAAIDAATGRQLWVYDPRATSRDALRTTASSTAGSPGGRTARRRACTWRPATRA